MTMIMTIMTHDRQMPNEPKIKKLMKELLFYTHINTGNTIQIHYNVHIVHWGKRAKRGFFLNL